MARERSVYREIEKREDSVEGIEPNCYDQGRKKGDPPRRGNQLREVQRGNEDYEKPRFSTKRLERRGRDPLTWLED